MIETRSPTDRIARFGRAALLASLTGAALLTGSLAAGADPAGEIRTVIVSYDDLNPATPAGAESLYHRIRSAAQSVCGSRNERVLAIRQAARRCHQAAVSEAVAASNLSALRSVHRAKTGQEPRG